jgi:hypothetical protein
MPISMLSPSAVKRLPTAVRALPEKAQLAFVFLRMRKTSGFIAKELKIPHSEAELLVKEVQETLFKSGSADLIRDPVFFPIDAPSDGFGGSGMDIPGKTMDIAEQVELKRFLDTLRKALESAPRDERRLLSLWFDKELMAKDILSFYKNLGVSLMDGKPIGETSEQDVFYAIEKSVRNLLKSVRSNVKGGGMDITVSTLRAILDEMGA